MVDDLTTLFRHCTLNFVCIHTHEVIPLYIYTYIYRGRERADNALIPAPMLFI